jgi:Ca2+-binding EF-hand superfamily protein
VGELIVDTASNRVNKGVDFNQFHMWAVNWQTKSEREKEHAATFKKLDTDKSGTLSLKEANAGISSWAKENNVKMT